MKEESLKSSREYTDRHRNTGGLDATRPPAFHRSVLRPRPNPQIKEINRIGRDGRIGQGGLSLVFFLVRELTRAPISV